MTLVKMVVCPLCDGRNTPWHCNVCEGKRTLPASKRDEIVLAATTTAKDIAERCTTLKKPDPRPEVTA